MRVLRSIVQVAAFARFATSSLPSLSLTRTRGTCCRPFSSRLKKRFAAPATLRQDIEHDPVLIDGTPEIMQFALDPDEGLI
jgi:hypothetical protein